MILLGTNIMTRDHRWRIFSFDSTTSAKVSGSREHSCLCDHGKEEVDERSAAWKTQAKSHASPSELHAASSTLPFPKQSPAWSALSLLRRSANRASKPLLN